MHRSTRALTAAALAGTLALAACSGGDDSGASQPTPEPTPSMTTSDTAPPTDDATTSAPGPGGVPTTTAPPTDDTATSSAPEPEGAELPGGGMRIDPDRFLYGYSGNPTSTALGRLGIGDIDERVDEIVQDAPEYAGDRKPLPVLELIATIVHGTPGADGTYRTREPEEVVESYLETARRHDGILLLNIQPGNSPMLDEVEHWEEFLREPDVGVALDPEWDVAPGQVPGQVYGTTEGSELDDISAYLDGLVEEYDLPQKVMVYHQVHRGVVTDIEELTERDGVVVINSVDGIGAPGDKIATYDLIMQDRPDFVVPGFKLFFEEDAALGPLMTPEEVRALHPRPEYVLWE